jgi:pheromone shutdown protein TraB
MPFAEHHSSIAITVSPVASLTPVAAVSLVAIFIEVAVNSVAVAKIAVRHVRISLPDVR